MATIKIFLALVFEVAQDYGINIFDTEVKLPLVKSGYMMERFIPTIQDVDSEKRFIREPVRYERRVQRIFATDRLKSSGDNRNNFVLCCGGGENGCGLWGVRVLPCFRITVEGSKKGEKDAFLQYVEMTRLIHMEDDTLRCIFSV